jgi:hypothetical protein
MQGNHLCDSLIEMLLPDLHLRLHVSQPDIIFLYLCFLKFALYLGPILNLDPQQGQNTPSHCINKSRV